VRLLSKSPLPAISLALSLSVAQVPALLADDLGDALLTATRKSDVAQVKSLLDKGADVNAKTRYNQTPLFFACDRGNLEIAKLLIDKGADLNVKDNFYNATPLTWALEKKNKEITALLISKGVDPSQALRQSIQSGDKEMLQLVLDKGKTTQEMLGDALQLAENAKKTEIIEALKAKGAKIVVYEVDAETLNGYVGSYSDGSNAIDFLMKEGKLTFSQSGFSAPMTPFEKDGFKLVQAGLTMHFTRDENGKVAALSIPGRGGDTVFKKKETSQK
jgi:ankyrin repeat protein